MLRAIGVHQRAREDERRHVRLSPHFLAARFEVVARPPVRFEVVAVYSTISVYTNQTFSRLDFWVRGAWQSLVQTVYSFSSIGEPPWRVASSEVVSDEPSTETPRCMN